MGRLILAGSIGPRRAFAICCLILGLCSRPAAGTTTASGDLAADTLWEGRIEVTGEVRVAKGATLLIQPGTVVRFAPGKDEAGQFKARLFVSGTLVAQGTTESPITFESAAESPRPGDWGGIVLEKANVRPSRISQAIIRHGAVGLAGTSSILVAEDVTIRDCLRGISALQEFKGHLSRGTISGNGTGVYYYQNSGFQLEGCDISKNPGGGIQCILNSSPAIRFSTIADNGESGIACIQGSSPQIEGNTIRGHRRGIYLELQSRPRIVRNTIRENETGIWGEKLVFPTVEGNIIADNGRGIYCNFSAYPVIHGNHILGNRTFGLVLGDNMSILMEKRIPFRSMGRFSFTPPPENAQPLPKQTKRFDPLPEDAAGIVDARGNWWGQAATAEMAKLGPDGNSSVIEDFFDKPDTLFGAETFRRDQVTFTPWESAPLTGVGPPPQTWSGVRGKVTSEEKPVAGVRVHAYETAAGNFLGEGISYSAPTAADGSFSLYLAPGEWYLIAKAPLPPFPNADPSSEALFGNYGGNPVTIAPETQMSVTIRMVAKLRGTAPTTTPVSAASGITGIRGTLRDAAGKALAGAHALATSDPSFKIGEMPPYRSAPVGADGVYFIEIPAAGTFYVSARSGYGGPPLPGEWHGFHGETKPAPVIVEANRVTEGITVVLKKME